MHLDTNKLLQEGNEETTASLSSREGHPCVAAGEYRLFSVRLGGGEGTVTTSVLAPVMVQLQAVQMSLKII